MTSFQNDTLVFFVVYRDRVGVQHRIQYDTFAEAAGHAMALDGVTRCLDAEFSNESSSWSGSMYIIDRHGSRRVANEYFLKSVIKFIAKQQQNNNGGISK